MTRALRSELLKLRRPRVLYGTLTALFAFTLLVTILSVTSATTERKPRAVSIADLTTTGGLTIGFANASRLVGLVILVLFLTSMTTEHTFGTLRVLLVHQPNRLTLLTGKFLALLAATAGALLAALLLSVAAATATMAARDLPTSDWFTVAALSHLATTYLNALAACTTYGAIGLTLGVLLRSTVLAVGVTLAWFFMAENIAVNVWPAAEHWFPGLVAGAVLAGGTDTVTYTHALTLTAAYTAAALLTAAATFKTRDVRS